MSAPVLDLDRLTVSEGFIIQGDAAGDRAGWSVSGAGDVNNDGIADLIVGALDGDDGGTAAGEAYVVYGVAGSTRTTVDLSNLTASQGFIIQGDAAGDQAGLSVSAAGDINGDTIDDLIVGAPFNDAGASDSDEGAAYVVYGVTGSTRGTLDLSSLTTSEGYVIQGDSNFDRAGWSVSDAGDVNNDGIGDLLVGAVNADTVYVVYGVSGTTRTTVDLSTLTSTQGYAVDGASLGQGVSAAGDVNGDTIDDFIVGANIDGAGHAYVIYGTNGSTRTTLDVSSLTTAQGFEIEGDALTDRFGWSVSDAGDINGDGIGDLIIGAYRGNDGGTDAGEAYVIYGVNGTSRGALDVTNLTASQGFVIRGDTSFDEAGYSVSRAGDVNDDGIDDLLVGAYRAGSGGRVYVIYGTTGTTRGTLDLSNLSESEGFVVEADASFDQLGISVSDAGDVNNDGFDDFIIGAQYGDDGGSGAGEAYVIYGADTTPPAATLALVNAGADNRAPTITLTAEAGATLSLSWNGGGAYQNLGVATGAAQQFTVPAPYDADGIYPIILRVRDAAGNQTEQTLNFTVDTVAELSEIDLVTASDTGTINDDVTSDTTPTIDFVAENGANVAIDWGDGNGFTAAGNGTGIRQVETIPTAYSADGIYTVTVRVTDAAGNTTQQTIDITIDTTGPLIGGTLVHPLDGLDVGSLTPSQGFVIQGDRGGDQIGFSVSDAGDVNGDGIGDLLIGAPLSDGDSDFVRSFATSIGSTYVVYGVAGATRGALNLTNLSSSQGYEIFGDAGGDQLGYSVSGVGDINGDGIDDLIIGVPYNDDGGSGAGQAYVIYGVAGTPGTLDVTTLTAAQGFAIQGDTVGDNAGFSVSGAGDVNGDGINDLIIGAVNGDDGGSNSGEAYVIYGTAGATRGTLDLTNLTQNEGFLIRGDVSGDMLGWSVSDAGDVNGDGIDDVIIGATGSDSGGQGAGAAYILYGATGTRGTYDLSTLSASEAMRIVGGDFDNAGFSVSGIGDVNGDGYDDVVIGATGAEFGAGAAYVVFGNQNSVDLDNLQPGQGYRIEGIDALNGPAGYSVSGIGDINSDGIDDLIVGARNSDTGGSNAGEAYVIFGTRWVSRNTIDLADLSPSEGFNIVGDANSDLFGHAVSGAGDVNGDGLLDLVVGAIGGDAGASANGEVYVIYGANFGITGAPGLAPRSDTGTAGDAITSDTRPYLAISSEAGSLIRINWGAGQGLQIAGTATGDMQEFRAGAAYTTDGNRTITVQATDVTGNVTTQVFTITIDTQVTTPTVSLLGALDASGLTNDATPTIQYTAEAGATVEIDWGDGNGYVAAGTGTGAAQQATLGTPYPADGPRDIFVRVTDAAGNSATQDLSIVIDNAVALSAVDLIAASDTGTSATDDLTADTTPTIQFTAEAGATIQIDWDDGNGFVAAGTATGAAQQVTLGTAYGSGGARDITVRVTDAAGNVATQTLDITVDTATTLSAIDLVAAADTGASDSDDLTNDTTPTIAFTAEAGATVEIDWDDGTGFVAAGTGTGSSQRATLATGYAADGTRDIAVCVTDAAGNTQTRTLSIEVITANRAPTGDVVISGTAEVGQTVRADISAVFDPDGIDTGTIRYQWLRDGVLISGATAQTYQLTNADAGQTITVQLFFTDDFGANESVTSPTGMTVPEGNSAPQGALLITGGAVVGQALTADFSGISDADGINAGSVQIEWFADGVSLGVFGQTFRPGESEAGTAISATYSYTDGRGNAETVTSAATDAVVSLTDQTGTEDAETLSGTAGADQIQGLGGNDTIYGNAGPDVLDGGDGDDLVGGGPGADTLLGGDGADSLFGAAGNDSIFGGAGDDLLGGAGGNDTLSGNDGADELWTATGDDSAFGGAGNDTLGGAAGNDTLSGEAGDDEIWGAVGNDSLIGGDGADTLGGSVGDDTAAGGADSDEIWGAAGDDSLSGDAGGDRIGAGTGNDTVDGGDGDDEVFGGLDDDDVMGGAGNDTIYGAAGNDTLAGGTGDDELYAGPGLDVIIFNNGDGADTLFFFQAADDTLQIDAALIGGRSAAQVVADFGSDQGSDFVLDFGVGGSLTLAGQAGIIGLETSINIV